MAEKMITAAVAPGRTIHLDTGEKAGPGAIVRLPESEVVTLRRAGFLTLGAVQSAAAAADAEAPTEGATISEPERTDGAKVRRPGKAPKPKKDAPKAAKPGQSAPAPAPETVAAGGAADAVGAEGEDEGDDGGGQDGEPGSSEGEAGGEGEQGLQPEGHQDELPV